MKRALVLSALVACGGNIPDSPRDASVSEPGPPPPPAWRPVLQELDGALLSVWGTSTTDVWTVGGPLGNAGYESLVMRFDGTAWRRAPTGKAESFWWVHGTSANDVWLVGEKGRITHWDGAAFTEMTSGTDATLFGVWAAAPNDAWAVGGSPESPSGANDVVLHWDGTSWKPELLPAPSTSKKVALFKVWGSSPTDLYIVGEAGVIWHRVQGTWMKEGAGLATGRLTTVAGCSATEVYAVGGRDLLVSDGRTWKRADISPLLVLNDLNGVSCAPNGVVVVVGGGSLKLRNVPKPGGTKAWETDFGSEPLVDLHGAWADPSGALWGAGGQFAAAARPNVKRQGTLARHAADVVSNVIAP